MSYMNQIHETHHRDCECGMCDHQKPAKEKPLSPSDATPWGCPSSEVDNDTEAELAAWELLRDARTELETLRDAVRNMRDAKGRFHTQLACERLVALLPESAQAMAPADNQTPTKETTL